jgi:hypothetical protein
MKKTDAGSGKKTSNSKGEMPAGKAKPPRKPRRYIPPKKGREWYERAEGQIAIKQKRR